MKKRQFKKNFVKALKVVWDSAKRGDELPGNDLPKRIGTFSEGIKRND